MGEAKRIGPKSLILVSLYTEHREALEADWLAVWGEPWIPATETRPGNYGLAQAWRMTRIILNRHDSNTWAALAGWWYIPSPQEQAFWDEAAAENRIAGHSQEWRPWSDSTGDPFKPVRDLTAIHAAKEKTRAVLKARFNIKD